MKRRGLSFAFYVLLDATSLPCNDSDEWWWLSANSAMPAGQVGTGQADTPRLSSFRTWSRKFSGIEL